MPRQRIIVIGAGAAGLMAAGQAAHAGAEVFLIEKKARPGLKLGLTGNGRCNITNAAPLVDFLDHYGSGGPFLRQAFARFFSSELAEFFDSFGINLVAEDDGRVFPASGGADLVIDILINWVKRRGVHILTGMPVERLHLEQNRVVGVVAHGKIQAAKTVIIATGGASYPATGSTGDGYRLAKSVGHRIVPIQPSLVPLIIAGGMARELKGLALKYVVARLLIDSKAQRQTRGEVLFTHYGVSGPTVLSLSRWAVAALREHRQVSLSIDLLPEYTEQELNHHLIRESAAHGRQKARTILRSLLPDSLIAAAMSITGINPDIRGNQITAVQRGGLIARIKNFRLDITGHRPLAEAMVTAGGVDTKEVDPRTMASGLAPGLYFAGEVLDIDGDTGGFNLQAAFSTGWVAGRSAGEYASCE